MRNATCSEIAGGDVRIVHQSSLERGAILLEKIDLWRWIPPWQQKKEWKWSHELFHFSLGRSHWERKSLFPLRSMCTVNKGSRNTRFRAWGGLFHLPASVIWSILRVFKISYLKSYPPQFPRASPSPREKSNTAPVFRPVQVLLMACSPWSLSNECA